MRTLALQLYTVRHALERDAEETLRQVREAGYQAVETAPLPPGLSAQRLGALLRELGLHVAAAHTELPLGEHRNQVLDEAAELGTSRIVWSGWPRDPAADSLDGYRRLADRYAEAASVAREHGLGFGLHNHWWEFELLEGAFPYQLLHQRLPSEIFFELDVYWTHTAKQNPVTIIAELGPRLALLHLKDGPAVHGQPMTALGEGVVDIAGALRAASPAADWVVELDECATDPMDAARRSFRYLSTFTP